MVDVLATLDYPTLFSEPTKRCANLRSLLVPCIPACGVSVAPRPACARDGARGERRRWRWRGAWSRQETHMVSYARGSRPTRAPSPLPVAGPVAPLLATSLGAARTSFGFGWRVGEKVAKLLLIKTRRALVDVGHSRRHSGGVPTSALRTTHESRFEVTGCTQIQPCSISLNQHVIRGPQRLITCTSWIRWASCTMWTRSHSEAGMSAVRSAA